ncbi:hypothetical protein [Photorhabdus khanii]|uniref:hypothetical protein n=1 Tax=Photorhabdus khanii TaxID=1004150 RepID=UPI00103DB235|nr:hypothetical protein [Photorhabdus khanii]
MDQAKNAVPGSRKINDKALSGDVSLSAGDVGAFKLGSSGGYSYKDGVPWNAVSGIYNLSYSTYSALIAHFSDGIGSCPAFQLHVGNRNSGIAYRSARDSYGFEEDWTNIYTTKNKPSAGDVGAYHKSESDNKYQPKGNYQPTGNYSVRGESYTKQESDGRYQPKDRSFTVVYSGVLPSRTPVNLAKNIWGKLVILEREDGIFFFFYCMSRDGIYAIGGDNSTEMRVSGNGSKIEFWAGGVQPVKVYILE